LTSPSSWSAMGSTTVLDSVKVHLQPTD
jgi:hypothetical protein